MPQISNQKREKISEQILAHLFNKSPESIFTSKIAEEIARDEDFTLSILKELEKNKLVIKITKNPNGIDYLRRQRWRLSNSTFDIYKKHQ
jgi:DNA-binding IscR family transcriptional regulator